MPKSELTLQLSQENSNSRSILQLLQDKAASNAGLLRSMNALLRRVYGNMGMMTNLMSSIRSLVSQILSMTGQGLQVTVATYQAVLAIQQALSSPLEPRSLVQEPFILEDAIGRVSPVHLQFVTSWRALDAVLQARFEGINGHDKVKQGEFVLQERATGRDICRHIPWEAAFRSGQGVEMAILFRKLIELKPGDRRLASQLLNLNACPNCRALLEGEERQDTKWYGQHNQVAFTSGRRANIS